MAATANKKHIIVVGAGVTGLTSALFLAEAGYAVTIVSEHVPGETHFNYTSPWAGAHWHTAAKSSEPMLCDFDVQTYKYWVDIIAQEEKDVEGKLPRSGLKMQDSHHFWSAPDPTADHWYSSHMQNFHSLSTKEAPISEINTRLSNNPNTNIKNNDNPLSAVTWGTAYRAPSLNTPQYLLYLSNRCANHGIRTIKASLPTSSLLPGVLSKAELLCLSAGLPAADAFVNATGLAAGRICSDQAVHPVRGQTVLVKGEAFASRTWKTEGGPVYCIPRPGSGTTVLGGTREKGVWGGQPDEATTGRILAGNAMITPELLTGEDGGFEVLDVRVGLRPGRDGGPRIEKEVVREVAGWKKGLARRVVHSYGHSGAGYQNSIGSARLVVKLMGELLGADGPKL